MVRRGPLCEKGEGGAAEMGVVRRQGGAVCVVDYRLMHGYVDVREAVWGKGILGRDGLWYRLGESL